MGNMTTFYIYRFLIASSKGLEESPSQHTFHNLLLNCGLRCCCVRVIAEQTSLDCPDTQVFLVDSSSQARFGEVCRNISDRLQLQERLKFVTGIVKSYCHV